MSKYLIDIAGGCMRPMWTNMEAAGLIPYFLDAADKRPCVAQLSEGYQRHAGARWCSMKDAQPEVTSAGLAFKRYEMDDPYKEMSRTVHPQTGETVIVFECDFVAVIAKDGTVVDAARMD